LKKELQLRWMTSKDKHGFIFQARTGKPLDPKNVLNRWFKPAAKRAREKAEKKNDQASVKAFDGLTLAPPGEKSL
jgi:hypothetical protein